MHDHDEMLQPPKLPQKLRSHTQAGTSQRLSFGVSLLLYCQGELKHASGKKRAGDYGGYLPTTSKPSNMQRLMKVVLTVRASSFDILRK